MNGVGVGLLRNFKDAFLIEVGVRDRRWADAVSFVGGMNMARVLRLFSSPSEFWMV